MLVLRCGALESKGEMLKLFENVLAALFWYIFMNSIILMNGIIFMNGIICRRWGRGRKGREDSTVGKASGRGQLTKADRGRSNMQGVGTQRR